MWLAGRVLSNLEILPLVVRELLRAHPYPYFYGSIAADITLAKRYVHYSRHCHNWTVAYEILDRAETPPLQSFALGYLSHLAADTIAHNVFVPRLLASTPLSSNLGHTYWEYRFDAALDDRYLRLAREIVTMDHEEPDALMESVLTQAFFSFQTNKRIFQRLIHLSNQERWNNLWVKMADKSKWVLSDADVERYGRLTRGYVDDLLVRGATSLSQALDPTGHERLALAKKLRRQSFREARREAGREVALDPIMATRTGETARMIATHPVPRYEMEMLAAVYFPEPAWP
ncbi:MAG TPA: zinc dependent phospholipase C family protein, partial [Gemmatimonadota bacterium]|nr:zinc dependent phospholipase C family protein [Gemmatimonadota bacterium]